MSQGSEEHPRVYLARLKEAAILAEILDPAQVEIRFQTGLLPNIIIQCKLMGASTFDEYLKCSDGYWDAFHQKNIALVDSPFNVRTMIRPSSLIPKVTHPGKIPSNTAFINPNVPANSLNVESPTIVNLTSSMEALQLNHMETSDVNGPSVSNIVKMDETKFDEKLRLLVDESIRKHFSNNKSYNNNNNNNDRRNNTRNGYRNNYNDGHRNSDHFRNNDNQRNYDGYRNNYGNNYNKDYQRNNDQYQRNDQPYRPDNHRNHYQDNNRSDRPVSNDHRNNQPSKN